MKIFKIVILISILICISFFVKATDIDKVVISLNKVGYNFITLIFITFVAYFLAAIGWRFCFSFPGRAVSLGRLFIVRHVGETIGFLNPASILGGEAAKIYMLKAKGIDRSTVVTSVLLSRLIMILSQLILLVVAGIFLFKNRNFPLHTPPLSVFLQVLLLISVLFILFKNIPIIQLEKTKAGIYIKTLFHSFYGKFLVLRKEIESFFHYNKKELVLSFLFFLLHWIVGALEFYFILIFLDNRVDVVQAILIDMGVIIFKSAGAFVPGQIGVEEYGNKVMLAAIGVHSEEIWLSCSLIRRARQLFWIGFALLMYFLIVNRQSSKLSTPDGDLICKS